MALTSITGADGSITMPAEHGGAIRQWTATVEYVTSEVTGFAAARNRRYRRGMPQLTGTATGTPQGNVSGSQPGVGLTGGPAGFAGSSGVAGLQIVLISATFDSACSWTNTVIMRSIGLSSDKVGDATITFDFISGDADDFVEAWDIVT